MRSAALKATVVLLLLLLISPLHNLAYAASSGWTSVGPAGVPGGFISPEKTTISSGGGNRSTSGTVKSIGYSSDMNTLYTAGGANALISRGIWKSSNGGKTWAFSGLANLMVTGIIVNPSNSDEVLANGIGSFSTDSFSGIMKSTDGGQTWKSTNPVGGYALVMSSSGTIYAATWHSLLESKDFGGTWTTVLKLPGLISAVAIADDGQSIYLGEFSGAGDSPPEALLRFSGGTLATLWRGNGSRADFESIVVNPANPQELWFLVNSVNSYAGYLYHSTDGGQTWQGGNGDGRIQCAMVDPNNPATVLTGVDGELDEFNPQDPSQCRMVLSGFDFRSIVFAHGELMVGTDQGLFVSGDDGRSWHGLNERPSFLVSSVAAGSSATIFYAQDYGNPFGSRDGGATWQGLGGGVQSETSWVVTDPYNASWMIELASPASAGAQVPGGLGVSNNGGATFQSAIASFPPIDGVGNSSDLWAWSGSTTSSFVAFVPDSGTAYMVADPSLYGTGPSFLFKTTDYGRTWNALNGTQYASEVAVAAQNPNTIYIERANDIASGDGGFGIYTSSDGGQTWAQEYSIPEYQSPHDISVDPLNDSNIIMIDNNGYIDRSTNGGSSFALSAIGRTGSNPFVSDGLEANNLPVDTLYTYRLSSGRVVLILLTEYSLYASFDFGSTWASFSQGLPPLQLTSFSLSPQGDAYVSTWGYGIWKWQDFVGALDSAPLAGSISTKSTHFSSPVQQLMSQLPLVGSIIVALFFLTLIFFVVFVVRLVMLSVRRMRSHRRL